MHHETIRNYWFEESQGERERKKQEREKLADAYSQKMHSPTTARPCLRFQFSLRSLRIVSGHAVSFSRMPTIF